MPVPSQGSERLCICVLRVSILSLSTVLIFDLGIVFTVWYFFYILLSNQIDDYLTLSLIGASLLTPMKDIVPNST